MNKYKSEKQLHFHLSIEYSFTCASELYTECLLTTIRILSFFAPGSKVLFIVTDHHTLWSAALSSYMWSHPQSLRLIQRELYTGAITLDFSDLVEKNSRHDIHEKHSLISKTIVWKYIFSTKFMKTTSKE